MVDTTESCNICCEIYNDERYMVSCSKCKYHSCSECYINFFRQETTANISCMNCKIEWKKLIQEKYFCKKDLEEIDKIQQEHLMQVEKRYMADTTKDVNILNDILKRRKLMSKMNKLTNKRKNNEKVEKLREEINNLQHKDNYRIFNNVQDNKVISYIMRCDSCPGFISNNFVCNLCKSNICEKCGKKKQNENHKCKKSEMLDFQDILKTTKPCPKCFTRIFKIEGCDQMFCTNCKTAFSWNKGIIDKGPIHNPHYFEMLRNNHIQENNCEEIFRINLRDTISLSIYDKLENIRRNYINVVEYDKDTCKNIRIRYIQGYLNENDFKREVLEQYYNIECKKEYSELINTLVIAIHNILNLYTNTFNMSRDEMIEKINDVSHYINEHIDKLSKIFTSQHLETIDLKLT